MSDDRFVQEEAKDDDVESHRRRFGGTDEPGSEEPGSEESDDVEAHRHKGFKANLEPGLSELNESDDVEAHRHKGFKANEEAGSDDSDDDVEAHRHKGFK
jgi:hypothetical protein